MRPGGVIFILIVIFLAAPPAGAACTVCPEALALKQAGECKKAVKLLKKSVKEDPESSEAHALLAICYARLGKAKAALNAVNDHLKLSPPAKLTKEVVAELTTLLGKDPNEPITFELPDLVARPVLLIQPPPSYPEKATELGIVADIILEATVDETGVPRDPVVRESDDSMALEDAGLHEAAINAVLSWRFIPALKGNTPVSVKMTSTVHFGIRE